MRRQIVFRKAIAAVMLAGSALGVSGATLAQSGTHFTVRIENVSGTKASALKSVGVFNKPIGIAQPGPATPGNGFEFWVHADPGDRLAFTTMFGQSNDWFFGPDEKGIALYDASGKAVSGDFSSAIKLWDAGTEVDEEPGQGPNQGPRQPKPNTGADEHGNVREVTAANEPTLKLIPNAADYLKLTITPSDGGLFAVRIDNLSANAVVPTPVSPGVYVITDQDAPIFTSGQPDRGQGLENQSEDGNPVILAHSLDTTEHQAHISPGVFVVHTADNPIFAVGQVDFGQGLEAQAEDGNPDTLAASVQSGGFVTTGVYNTAVGAAKKGPIGPGQAFEFSFDAAQGQYLTFASMFGDSNDLFIAPDGHGIALYNAKGAPISGEITLHLKLWDAGTEINQEPFVGPDQAPRQAAPNTGALEHEPIRAIEQRNDGFRTPSVFALVKVTITSDNGVEMNMMSADSNPAMMMTPEAMSDSSMMATEDAMMGNNMMATQDSSMMSDSMMATPEATTSMGG